ncbi:MAG: HPr family phosphocarrier protein [Alphaproteobacteria bacterium]|nr:HPr family phosphocarrier protein [Alphaproteobacteria bacterium]
MTDNQPLSLVLLSPAPDREAQRRSVEISNRLGLHARAAAKFVKLAGRFDAEVQVSHKSQSVAGLSILGLMMLAAGPGCVIEIEASGNAAAAVLDALTQLVADKFGEE